MEKIPTSGFKAILFCGLVSLLTLFAPTVFAHSFNAHILATSDGHYTLAFSTAEREVLASIDQIRANHPGHKVWVKVTDSAANFKAAANDPYFAQNVRNILTHCIANGVIIDWELGLQKDALNKLLTSLHTSLRTSHLQLIMTVWPFVVPAYDVNVFNATLDHLAFMSPDKSTDLEYALKSYRGAGFTVR